ncbi:MAG: hypothetical protein AAFX40_03775 [Cyanobacteria bacterium J06639_1]
MLVRSSNTDGQIYLSPDLFQKGILPAVDAGKSVSRVGGKTQLPAYRAVAGTLRLTYSQFEELEAFSRFNTRLDDATQQAIVRGQRVREVLKQSQYAPIPAPEQIAVLFATTQGCFDRVPLADIPRVCQSVRAATVEQLGDLCDRILAGKELTASDRQALLDVARSVLG